jgi:transcriptional regulator with XRE-family HTH domain
MRTTIAKKKPKSSKGKPKGRNLTLPEMAEGIGVSVVTIHKYLKRGCPRTSIAAVQKWRSENIKAVAEDTEVSEIGIELKKAEIAERWENARTRQLKNDIAEGRLIRKDEVERSIAIAVARFVNRLNTLGMRCANLCPSELKAPVKESIEDQVKMALKELSADMEKLK